MKKRKTLQDLTIKDNFMFGAVMSVEENCKGFLEMVLGFPIARVVVSKEKSMIYNVEMQVRRKKALGKRSRYYHSQIVMEALESGEDYDTLPATFVIFVCDFDPFDKKRYCYTFRNICEEDPNVKLEDDSCTIFLSTKGENEDEVSQELVRFLKFVTADLKESEMDFGDGLVQKFQKTIRQIKTDREMGERYMIFEEMLREEKQEGREEGRLEATQEAVLELLKESGEIPCELQEKIRNLENLETLKALLKLAARADSLRAFEEKAEEYFNSEDKE